MNQILLGVNVDHVATLRQARGTRYPDPVYAAMLAEEAGADGITVHLREDRRHIQERDIRILKQTLQTRMNLEMAVTDEMVQFALSVHPEHCCLVPEKRQELTTEGGLDVVAQAQRVEQAVQQLMAAGIAVSLFIDPEPDQVSAAVNTGAAAIEIHTGCYAEAPDQEHCAYELQRIERAVKQGINQGLLVNAGHGLHYHNVSPVAAIAGINELNIGHGLIAQSLFVGIKQAVADMKALMNQARSDGQ